MFDVWPLKTTTFPLAISCSHINGKNSVKDHGEIETEKSHFIFVRKGVDFVLILEE